MLSRPKYSQLFLLISSLLIFANTVYSTAEARVRRQLSSMENTDTEISNKVTVPKKEFNTGFSSGGYTSNTNSSEIKAIASIGYLVSANLQMGGEGGFIITNYSGDSVATYQAFLVGTYNFEPRINGSFFLKAGLGVVSYSAASSSSSRSTSSKSGFFLGLGKRIFLWPHLSYSPEFRFTQYDSSSSMEFKALNFSIFF